MNQKLSRLLFPPMWVLCALTPIAVALLAFSMAGLGTDSPISYLSYALAAYTLTAWCLRTPKLVRSWKRFSRENKHLHRWLSDKQLRGRTSLHMALLANAAFSLFWLGLGIFHASFWFYTMAGYYGLLAFVRLYLRPRTKRQDPLVTLRAYRTCGITLLCLNLILSLLLFFMIYRGRTFYHHPITTITIAAYTFASLTVTILRCVKDRHATEPIFLACNGISLASACVSMLTLASTMLTTFGGETTTPEMRTILLSTSGGVISLFIILMAIGMIVNSTKQIKQHCKEHLNESKE